MARPAPSLQRFVLRTQRGRLRPLWHLAYAVIARAYVALLRGRDRGAAAYLRGSRTPTFGLSDIDPVVIVPPDPRGQGVARGRVLARRERLCRLAPRLCDTLLDVPYVFEGDEAERTAPAPLIGLDGSQLALYFGRGGHSDRSRIAEHPDLYGRASEWRRVAGAGRRPASPSTDAQERRVVAWLSLQAIWRWYLQACHNPTGLHWADLCVKAVAHPARIWLWLARGERTDGRRGTLKRALIAMPEHEVALRSALELEGSLGSRSIAPDPAFARHLVDLSSAVADLMAAEVAEEGATRVRLLGGARDELALPPNPAWRLAPVVEEHRGMPLLALADWRALTRAWLGREGTPGPAPPDETLAPLSLDPGDLGQLAAAVAAGDAGPYPALRGGKVLVLASRPWSRTQLRGVQCAATDPVSFALLDGEDTAAYPAAAGWSAEHVARRSVAEHSAWLAHHEQQDAGAALAMILTAARAAMFLESVRDGDPALTLTAAATLRELCDRYGVPAGLVDETEESHRRYRLDDTPPPGALVAALRAVVVRLGPYRSR